MAKTTFTGPIVAGSNGTTGEIRLTDGKNVNEQKYLAIAAPATITADTTLTFPNGAGSAGQILSTDGNGTLSWVNDSAGNPDGTNGQVQFNDSGTFGAISEGTAGQVLTSNGAGTAPTFQAAAAGGIAAVVDDTSPQLGGNLDMNGRVIDGNGPGTNNVGIGNLAFANLSSGRDNTTVGYNAGSNLSTGSDNTFVGEGAGQNINSGDDNTAIGGRALNSAFAVSNTVAVGQDAGNSITSGDRNTFVGRTAGSTANGGNNVTCIGYNAEPSASNANDEITLGDNSVTALRIPGLTSGALSGTVLTYNGTNLQMAAAPKGVPTASPAFGNVGDSVFIEAQGIGSTESYTSDLVVNSGSIKLDGNHPTGINNVALGNNAGGNLSTGAEDNVLIGKDAGALCQNNDRSTVVGTDALKSCISGQNNTAIGKSALQNATSNDNTAIGREAGSNLTNGSNCAFVGQFAQPSAASATNEITLGNSSIATLRCQVTSITSLSDARDKKDVEDANIGLDFINDLRPVKFVWDTRDGAKKDVKEVGFIAQELDEVQQKHGVEDHLQLVLKNNPDKLEASQGKLIPILVQAIKDLKKEIDELKKA